MDTLWERLEDSPLAGSVQAVDQLTYLLLLQYLELEDDRRSRGRDAYDSVFEGTDDPMRWSYWRHLPAREQFDHLQRNVFPWLDSVGPHAPVPETLAANPVFLFPDPSLLAEMVIAIDDLGLAALPPAVRGNLYEYLVSKIKFERDEARKQGKYLTPRHLVSVLVEMLRPQIGQRVFDPACGTGGFLVTAYWYVLKNNTSSQMAELGAEMGSGPVGDLLDERARQFLQAESLIAIDSAREMSRVTAMNLLLHGIRDPDVRQLDSLGEGFNRSGFADVVITNPPFTKRDTALTGRTAIETRDSADLFIQLALDCLTPGGRAAIVVPDGAVDADLERRM